MFAKHVYTVGWGITPSMRRFLPLCLACILLAAFSCPLAQAEEAAPSHMGFGVAPGVGYFRYWQKVDRGFSINGRPYDLTWSGLQLQLSGDTHWQIPAQSLGLGLSTAFMLAPNPTGADAHHTVRMDPNKVAIGGQLALSLCFWPDRLWRLVVQGGAVWNGIAGGLGFGGPGIMAGLAVHRLLGAWAPRAGVGLRLTMMGISSFNDGEVRGENGFYGSILFEVLYQSAGARGRGR